MTRRGSYAKGIAKREEILATALEVVDRAGFRGASVRELADAVGLSQAGLLHYFDSKEELFTAILRKRDEVDTSRTAPGADMVETLLDVVRHNAETPGLVQLFASTSVAATSDVGHPAHDWFVDRYANVLAHLAGAVRARQDAGEIDPAVDADRLARVLVAVSDGMQVQWMLDPEVDMAASIELVWRLALAAVGSGAGATGASGTA